MAADYHDEIMEHNKKKVSCRLYISFLCLFFAHTTHTEVPFTWLLGIYAIMHPAYRHLSPINGWLCAEQKVVEKMYRDGNPLVKELFYLVQEDNVSFRPTILKSKPASYWTPATIGMIVAAISAYRENTAIEEDKKTALRIALARIMQQQRALIQTHKEEITKFITTKKETLRDITQQSKTLRTRIGQAQRKPCTYEQLNQKIAEIERLEIDYNFLAGTRKPIEKDINKLEYDLKFIDRALQSGIDNLIGYFLDSVQTQSSLKLRRTGRRAVKADQVYTTESILLTLLWMISNPRNGDVPKQDFVDYFNQLSVMIDNDNLHQWITTPVYTKKDYLQFNQDLDAIKPDMRKQYMAQHYEQTILAIKAQMLWTSPIPPIITPSGAVYTLSDGTHTERSPDCMETAFRNFFNLILYNAESSMFDTQRFIAAHQITAHRTDDTEDIPLHVSQKLINFYDRYKCVTNLQASELYNAWTEITKKIPGIVYMKPTEYAPHVRFYEVKSFFPNMLKICNYLLFGNNPLFNQLPRDKQLDIICNTVSRDDFRLSWDIVDADVEKNQLTNIDYVTLKFWINESNSFEWRLKKGHSVIPPIYAKNESLI